MDNKEKNIDNEYAEINRNRRVYSKKVLEREIRNFQQYVVDNVDRWASVQPDIKTETKFDNLYQITMEFINKYIIRFMNYETLSLIVVFIIFIIIMFIQNI